MAYALTSPLTSIKLTIDSDGAFETGTVQDRMYYLSNKIYVPNGFKALFSLESFTFRQPSKFRPEYYTGKLNVKTPDGVTLDLPITQFDVVERYRYIEMVLTQPNQYYIYYFILINTLNTVLKKTNRQLPYLRLTTMCPDRSNLFTNEETDLFRYNGVSQLDDRKDLDDINGILKPLADIAYTFHGSRCYLEFDDDNVVGYSYTITGGFVELLGLSPHDNTTVTPQKELIIRPPFEGHPLVNVQANMCKNNITNMFSDRHLTDSTLVATVPCPGTPGDIIYYTDVNANKLTLNTDNLDYLQIQITDRFGLPLYGIQEYVATFVIDFLFVNDDTDNSVSLAEIRKRLKR